MYTCRNHLVSGMFLHMCEHYLVSGMYVHMYGHHLVPGGFDGAVWTSTIHSVCRARLNVYSRCARVWQAYLNVLPAASKTTAKWVGGGSNSRSVSSVRMKANKMEVSSPVWVVNRTVFMPK